ncbi:hypothetical protein FRC01_002226 [Tulasnella sp. 417]|nr:hypothetical protein FRC01_002226 [Tulasnella sp. 417]
MYSFPSFTITSNIQSANLQTHQTDLAVFTNEIVNRLDSLVGATQDNGTTDSSAPKTSVRIADPGNFNGKPIEARAFASKIDITLQFQPSINTSYLKCLYFGQHLTGPQYTCYAATSETHMANMDMDPYTKAKTFYRGLKEEIKDLLVIEGKPLDLSSMINKAQQIEARIRERAMEKKEAISHYRAQFNIHPTPGTSTVVAAPTADPNAMEVVKCLVSTHEGVKLTVGVSMLAVRVSYRSRQSL